MKKILACVLAVCMLLACVGMASAEGKVYRVAILQLVQHNALDAATLGFRETLTELLGEGNVEFNEQNAQGDTATCAVIATGFANDNYDLIMANATPALLACVSATDTIPILGTSVTDYATALDDPDMDITVGTGINVSGASDGVNAQLYVDVLLELVPEAKKVNIIYCSAEPNSVLQADQFMAAMAATKEDVVCKVFTFADSNDIQSVVTAASEDVDAIYIPTDNTAASNMTIINNICQPAGIPLICGEENMMAAGGLATVSISYYDIGALAAQQAYEILANGQDVAATPIAYSANPVKEYNPDYAEALNFAIPDSYTAYTVE